MRRLFCSPAGVAFFVGLLAFAVSLGSCNRDPYKEGRDLMSKRDYKAAAQFFKGKLDTHSEDPWLRNEYGMALKRLNRIAEAKAQYREAVRLKPDYPEAHFNLGTALIGQGDYGGAAEELDLAIKYRPDYPKAYNNRSQAHIYSGDFEKAKDDLREAIRLEPDNAMYKDNLEIAKRFQEEFEKKAKEFFEKDSKKDKDK